MLWISCEQCPHQLRNYNKLCAVISHYTLVINYDYSSVELQQKFLTVLSKIFVVPQYFDGILFRKSNLELQSRYCKVKSQYLQSNFTKLHYKWCELVVKQCHHQFWNYNTLCAIRLHYTLVIKYYYSTVKLQKKFLTVRSKIFVVPQYFDGILFRKSNIELQSTYCKVKSQYF